MNNAERKNELFRLMVDLIIDIGDHFNNVPNVDHYTFSSAGFFERIDEILEKYDDYGVFLDKLLNG